ncbi:MAG: PA2779 family protein [Methylophaga sp.]|nr:PA2779 family protein [Methylophaga sp.]
MNFFRCFTKLVPILSILALFSMNIAPLQAAMVDNDRLISQSQMQMSKQEILTQLDRQHVQDKLLAMGVNIDDAKQRIDQMTQQELAQVAQDIENMPAGSGGVVGPIVGALLVVFIVLVVTDMLGATDVFGFVNDINH